MVGQAETDRSLSVAADEYVWATSEAAEVHEYLKRPVLKYLELSGAHSVLDLGCGNGAFSLFLSEAGYDVTGCDSSASGLRMARGRNAGTVFFGQDLTHTLPDEHTDRYDAVVSLEVIEHLLLPRKLMYNACRALRPGGVFLLSTPYHGYFKNFALALTNRFDDHWHPLRDYGHVKFFSKRTILSLFEEFKFQDVSFSTVGRVRIFARSMIVAGRMPDKLRGRSEN